MKQTLADNVRNILKELVPPNVMLLCFNSGFCVELHAQWVNDKNQIVDINYSYNKSYLLSLKKISELIAALEPFANLIHERHKTDPKEWIRNMLARRG